MIHRIRIVPESRYKMGNLGLGCRRFYKPLNVVVFAFEIDVALTRLHGVAAVEGCVGQVCHGGAYDLIRARDDGHLGPRAVLWIRVRRLVLRAVHESRTRVHVFIILVATMMLVERGSRSAERTSNGSHSPWEQDMNRTTTHESELDRLIVVADEPVLSQQFGVIVCIVFIGLGIGCVFVAIREGFGFKT